MELSGKKIAFLGDSITEGIGVDKKENIYWNRIAASTGAISYGYGISGTRIAVQERISPDPSWDKHFASRVETMIPDADIVVVFGGTNDFGHGEAPFGTMADRTEDTFCGAMHSLLQKLMNRYPTAQLVVMTPLHRLVEDEYGLNEVGVRRCGVLRNYVDAIMEIAGFYGIPVLDLFRVSGMQPRVECNRVLYMPDGIHPNDAGHELIARKLENFLKSL